MIRIILALLLFATPALGADWQRYQNPRYGFAVDVPASFALEQEADNGDGAIYRSADGRAVLRAYGGMVTQASFEDEVTAAMGYATQDGWALSYTQVTPDWASYSGTRGGEILYTRAVATCGGTQYVGFEIIYPKSQLADFDAVISHMVGSLGALDIC